MDVVAGDSFCVQFPVVFVVGTSWVLICSDFVVMWVGCLCLDFTIGVMVSLFFGFVVGQLLHVGFPDWFPFC